MSKSPSLPAGEYYSEQEATRRREAALQRMLRTPPKPHKPAAERPKRKPKGEGRPRRSSG